ncbi:hypothetical protein N7454_004383 [Penicillium verhagenii]|nr:hypothetical protein N7454_004383 [Penicillium verhagenii]
MESLIDTNTPETPTRRTPVPDTTEEDAAPAAPAAPAALAALATEVETAPKTRARAPAKKRPRGNQDYWEDEDSSEEALIQVLESRNSPTDAHISQEPPSSARKRKREPGF